MKKKNLILSLLGIFILAGGIYFWRKNLDPAVTYREVKVARGDIDLTILSTGTASPENRLEIKPPISGRVDSVLVKEGEKVKKGQVLAWMSSSERAAMLDAARAKGPDELKRWEEIYRPTPVLAPINGTLILRSIESGQTFTNADAVLVMSDRLTIKAQVDETDIAQIKVKQSARIVLDAYPDEKINAVVDQIAFDAKTVNNVTTYVVDVLPLKTPDYLRSGMTANVTFLVDAKKDILLLPSEAVRQENARASVLVRDENEKVLEKSVEVGVTDGKKIEIVSGLAENEVVRIAQTKPKEKSKNLSSPFGGPPGGRPPTRGR